MSGGSANRPRGWIAVAAAALALLAAPAAALACPFCAMNGPDGGFARYAFIGGMVAAPFFVALAVGRSIVAAARRGGVSASRERGEEARPEERE